MNKKKLFGTILITLLIFMGLTWIIKAGHFSSGAYTETGLNPLGIVDLFYLPLLSFQTFVQYGVFILAVGGFYGILSKTRGYNALINKVANRNKNRKTLFVAFTVLVFVLLSSILGVPVGLFALVPLFKDILENLGYDKKNIMLATIGSIFVGIIGSTLSFEVSGYLNYFYNIGYTDLLVAKIALLVLLSVLLVLYIKKTNKNFNEKEYEVDKKTKTFPLVLITALVFALGLAGMYSWMYGHEISFFNDFHATLSEIKIGDFAIVDALLGQNAKAIGAWSEPDFATMLLIGGVVIGWIYGLKFKEMYEGFVAGAKKLLPTSMFVTLSFVVLMPLYTSQDGTSILYTVINGLIDGAKEVSILTMSLVSAVATFFYGQFIYVASDLSETLTTVFSNTAEHPLMGLIMQSIYGLTLFVTPTSMLLLGGLSYFEVNYKEWFKHIFKFVLITLVILVVTFLIVGWVA